MAAKTGWHRYESKLRHSLSPGVLSVVPRRCRSVTAAGTRVTRPGISTRAVRSEGSCVRVEGTSSRPASLISRRERYVSHGTSTARSIHLLLYTRRWSAAPSPRPTYLPPTARPPARTLLALDVASSRLNSWGVWPLERPCPVWARERCRISPPRFLAECCRRQPVVIVVMCSRGGAQPLRSRRTKISIQCCTQKLHFKLTAYFPLGFKSRFMMKTAQETASRKRK